MDLASLQPSYSLSVAAGHQPSPAVSLPSGSVLPCRQSTSDPPGKAIGQRWCVANRDADSDREYYDALDCLPADCQKGLEEETDTGDGSWQVVTRRRKQGSSSTADRMELGKKS